MLANILRISNIFYFLSITVTLIASPINVFSAHPLSMCMTWLLISEGLISQKIRRPSRHLNAMFFSSVCMLLGFVAVYLVKESYYKQHFTSAHGFTGVCILVLLVIQVIASLFIKYSGVPGRCGFWPFHKIFGALMITGVFLVSWMHMGTRSSWNEKNGSIFGTLSLAISGISCTLLLFK